MKLFWMSKQKRKTIRVHNMFWEYSELAIFMYWTCSFNERSFVILRVIYVVDASINGSENFLQKMEFLLYKHKILWRCPRLEWNHRNNDLKVNVFTLVFTEPSFLKLKKAALQTNKKWKSMEKIRPSSNMSAFESLKNFMFTKEAPKMWQNLPLVL